MFADGDGTTLAAIPGDLGPANCPKDGRDRAKRKRQNEINKKILDRKLQILTLIKKMSKLQCIV